LKQSGSLAQLVEHFTFNEGVDGSNPSRATNFEFQKISFQKLNFLKPSFLFSKVEFSKEKSQGPHRLEA
jgi:hypothetical protein